MGRRLKEIVYPHLNDCKGDVQGKWYVEFSVLNKITGEKIRQRIYEGFDKYNKELIDCKRFNMPVFFVK